MFTRFFIFFFCMFCLNLLIASQENISKFDQKNISQYSNSSQNDSGKENSIFSPYENKIINLSPSNYSEKEKVQEENTSSSEKGVIEEKKEDKMTQEDSSIEKNSSISETSTTKTPEEQQLDISSSNQSLPTKESLLTEKNEENVFSKEQEVKTSSSILLKEKNILEEKADEILPMINDMPTPYTQETTPSPLEKVENISLSYNSSSHKKILGSAKKNTKVFRFDNSFSFGIRQDVIMWSQFATPFYVNLKQAPAGTFNLAIWGRDAVITFENIMIFTLDYRPAIHIYDFFIEGLAGGGFTRFGTKDLFSVAYNWTDHSAGQYIKWGYVLDFGVATGYNFDTKKGFYVTPKIGWDWNTQYILIRMITTLSGMEELPEQYFRLHWNSPWAGLALSSDITPHFFLEGFFEIHFPFLKVRGGDILRNTIYHRFHSGQDDRTWKPNCFKGGINTSYKISKNFLWNLHSYWLNYSLGKKGNMSPAGLIENFHFNLWKSMAIETDICWSF